MGASTALALTDRGHDVTIYEQFDINHNRGSSHGRSRIVRKAYPDPYYTGLMVEGYPMWHRLQERVAEPILFETGLVYFGAKGSRNMESLVVGLRANGVDQTELSAAEMKAVFPELHLDDDEVGYLTKDAGWVRAETAVRLSIEIAVTQGAKLNHERVDPEKLLQEFDRVLVCAGAWAKRMFNLPVRTNLQTFAYLVVPEPHRGPVWIDDHEHNVYGFPSEPGSSTVKFGIHSEGREIDPDQSDREPNAEHIELLQDFAQKRFGIENPILQEITTCIYTRTETEDFIFGEAAPNLFFASPCSGHGFKFGPWIGARMADFAEGRAHPRDFPRFTFANHQIG